MKKLQKENTDKLFKMLNLPPIKRNPESWELRPEASYLNLSKYLKAKGY